MRRSPAKWLQHPNCGAPAPARGTGSLQIFYNTDLEKILSNNQQSLDTSTTFQMIKIRYQQAATWSARARVPVAVQWHYQDVHVQRALPLADLQCPPRASA